MKTLCMIPQWWIHVIIHLSKAIQCTTPRANSDVNYGLWGITMCRRRFILCNKRPTTVGEAYNGAGGARVGAGTVWGISVLSPPFCCEYCPTNNEVLIIKKKKVKVNLSAQSPFQVRLTASLEGFQMIFLTDTLMLACIYLPKGLVLKSGLPSAFSCHNSFWRLVYTCTHRTTPSRVMTTQFRNSGVKMTFLKSWKRP